MSLAGNINLLATAIGQQIKTIKANMLQSLSIGTVTTGDAGSSAAATITGTAPNQVLNLTIPQGAAGTDSGGTSGVAYSLTQEYTNTQPATPATGITLFSQSRGRRLPAWVGPAGQNTTIQPSFAYNRVSRMGALNGSATVSTDNLAITAVGAGAAAVTTTTANLFSSVVRTSYATTATTAGSACGFRVSGSLSYFLSNTANMGGFHYVARCGIGTSTAGSRGFVGLSATGVALSGTVEPTTLLNLVGFGHSSTSTNWYFMSNGASGTATTVDLGANFPAKTSATDFFEFSLYVPSGKGTAVYWAARRLNDNAFVSGVATATLPALDTVMQGHIHYTNGTTAQTAAVHIQSLYIETDN